MPPSSFAIRSNQKEMMDDAGIGFSDFSDCLTDLAKVNALTLGYRPTLRWISSNVARLNQKAEISVLDIGSGGGDMLRQIARWAARNGYSIRLTGVDMNPWSRSYANTQNSMLPISYETSDVFQLRDERNYDFIINSLFTHHLTDDQIVLLMEWMDKHSRHGWFINDLHRHPVAYTAFKALSKLFGFHFMVQHDGPVSIKRAFTRKDWVGYLSAARIPAGKVSIRWFFPFRLCVERQLHDDA